MPGLEWISGADIPNHVVLPGRKLNLRCNILPEPLHRLDHTLIHKSDNILATILEFIYKYQIHKEEVERVIQK